MKLKNMIIMFIVSGIMHKEYAHPIQEIDPVTDFRCPESLFEIVHDGIVQIVFMAKKHMFIDEEMQSIVDSLRRIHEQFDITIQYQAPAIKAGDQEFLQHMLDRLDDLLTTIQGDEYLRAQAEDLMSQLRIKIMQYTAQNS